MARKKATSAAEVERAASRCTLRGGLQFRARGLALEKRMQEFAQQGLIMAYALMQDDSLSIAVAVGEPLSEKELGADTWHPATMKLLKERALEKKKK